MQIYLLRLHRTCFRRILILDSLYREWLVMSRIVAALLMSLGLVWGTGAQAQTACPSGVGPGSAQCGPDAGTSRGDSAPPQPTGYWIKTWGAIATSESLGEAGTTVGKLSESEARQAAIRLCAEGGAKDCKVHLVYRNQCAAFASSKDETFFQAAESEQVSIDLSLARCEKSGLKCKVRYSGCTEPIFQKY